MTPANSGVGAEGQGFNDPLSAIFPTSLPVAEYGTEHIQINWLEMFHFHLDMDVRNPREHYLVSGEEGRLGPC